VHFGIVNIGTLSIKLGSSVEVMQIIHTSKYLYRLANLTFYAISNGLAEFFSKPYVRLHAFFDNYNTTLTLPF